MKNPLIALTSYIGEVRTEMSKVTWLTRQDLVRHTIVVIASILVAMLIVAVIDLGLTKLVEIGVLPKGV